MQYRRAFGKNSKEERNLKTQAKWLKAGQNYVSNHMKLLVQF